MERVVLAWMQYMPAVTVKWPAAVSDSGICDAPHIESAGPVTLGFQEKSDGFTGDRISLSPSQSAIAAASLEPGTCVLLQAWA